MARPEPPLPFFAATTTITGVTEQIVGSSVEDLLGESREEVARLGMLVEAAGRLLGTLDLERVLPDVLDLAQTMLEADAYALWRRTIATDQWSLQASDGLSPEYVAASQAAIVGNENEVALDGPLVVPDVAAAEWLTPEHRAAHAAEGTQSFLAMPLLHREEVIGTLVFYSRRPTEFGESELRAATAVASVAAAAIGTASLYDEQARLAESRRLIAQASEHLASSLDYETTLANVAALVVPALADWCVIDIVGEDGAIQRLT